MLNRHLISARLLPGRGRPICHSVRGMTAALTPPASIFQVAKHRYEGADADRLRDIFRITTGVATCSLGAELASKFKMQSDNEQVVVSITNLWSLDQAWFNAARKLKPQTFKRTGDPSAVASADPTGGGGGDACDFCRPTVWTAADPGFGHIELEHVVTSSNLFKIAEPYHGLLIFRHHSPLTFSLPQLTDLMTAGSAWFTQTAAVTHAQEAEDAAAAAAATAVTVADAQGDGAATSTVPPPTHLHPFLLWNCLPRAGASQFHGHAQVLNTRVPLSAQQRLDSVVAAYADRQQHRSSDSSTTGGGQAGSRSSGDGGYYTDLLRAHRAVGLLRSCGTEDNRAWAFASLSPVKDMETCIMGSSITSPAFVRMLHAALRGLIDGLGATSFNVGILNIAPEATAGCGSGAAASNSSSQGLPNPRSTADAGPSPSPAPASSAAGMPQEGGTQWGRRRPGEGGLPGRPVMARIVTRGALGAPASDFGALEVLGDAAIGYTDPFDVIRALEEQLGADTGDIWDGLA